MRSEARKTLGQFVKFCLVGCSNLLISFSVYYILFNVLNTWANTPGSTLTHERLPAVGLVNQMAGAYAASIANCIAYGAGVINSFVWNRLVTFSAVDQLTFRFNRFIVLNLLCVVLSTVALYILVDLLSYPYKSAWFAVMTLITLFNFVSCKYWVAGQLAN